MSKKINIDAEQYSKLKTLWRDSPELIVHQFPFEIVPIKFEYRIKKPMNELPVSAQEALKSIGIYEN